MTTPIELLQSYGVGGERTLGNLVTYNEEQLKDSRGYEPT